MLVDVILKEAYAGISAGYETSLPKEIAEALIQEGKAISVIAPPVIQIKKGK